MSRVMSESTLLDQEIGNGLILISSQCGTVCHWEPRPSGREHPTRSRASSELNLNNEFPGDLNMAELPGYRMYQMFSPSLERQARAGVLAYEGRSWDKVKSGLGDYRIDRISFRARMCVPLLAETADTAPL